MPVLPTHPLCPWSFPAPRLHWMSGSAFPCLLPRAGAVRGRLEPRQSPGPAGTGAGGQREPHLSPAEPAPAGRNLTILIYQIDKILSLQLRGYVINCVLITAAATSSECSNLRRNRGRCFKFVCVNSGSANRAACAAPGGAGEGRGSPAASPPGPGGLWNPLGRQRAPGSPAANPGLHLEPQGWARRREPSGKALREALKSLSWLPASVEQQPRCLCWVHRPRWISLGLSRRAPSWLHRCGPAGAPLPACVPCVPSGSSAGLTPSSSCSSEWCFKASASFALQPPVAYVGQFLGPAVDFPVWQSSPCWGTQKVRVFVGSLGSHKPLGFCHFPSPPQWLPAPASCV